MRFSRVILLAGLFVYLSINPVGSVQAQDNTPQAITYEQTVTGELATPLEEVLYIFTATQQDAITVTMDSTNGSFDPLLILTDQTQQTVLAVDNDSGGNRNARLRFVIPTTGDYVIKATAVKGSGDINGSYTLTLTQNSGAPAPSLNAAPLPQVVALKPGEASNGELNDSVRFRLYTLRARANEPITASLEIPESPSKLQAGLYLYASDFREIARGELGQAINIKAPADGVYFLMVALAAPSSAGIYTLRQTLPTVSNTLAITPGQTVRGAISNDAAVKTYSLQGAQGQTVNARMRRLTGDLITYLYIVAIDTGVTVAQATDQNGVSELSTVLPADGTYAIVATRGGQQTGITTGEYALSLIIPGQETPMPAPFENHASLSYGDRLTGTIDNTTFAIPHVFTAQTGDVIQAVLTAEEGSGNLDAFLILQDINGKTLAEDNDSAGGTNARLQATIPESGQYALIVTRAGGDQGTTTGKYDLAFGTLSAPLSASGEIGTLLTVGEPQTGSSAIGRLYRFEAPAQTAVSFELAPAEDNLVVLTDSTFQQVAAGAITNITLPKDGTYYVFVLRAGGPNQPAGGDYTITLQGNIAPPPTAAPGTLVFGQPVTGTITNDLYQVRYTVQARQGATLIINLDAAPDSTLDPMVGVTDPDNNVLGVNDDASSGLKNASLTINVSKDGLYNIVATRAQEAQGTTTGDYVLTVSIQQTRPDILPIRYGGIINADITNEQFLYYYTFTGTAGDVITIKMNSVPGHSLDPVVYLYDYSSGKPELIAGNNDAAPGSQDAAIVDFALPQNGTYLIAATRLDALQGQTTGSFVLTLSVKQ
jgi:hypothetical protein